MAEMSVSEARALLPSVLTRVAAGEEVTITRHGQPVAVVVRPDALRHRRAEPAIAAGRQIAELLAEAGSEPLPARPGLGPGRAEELAAALRADRDGE